MSEGGIYPWKRQNLNVAKAADYSNLQNPLPKPPPGSAWYRDPSTREWKVISTENVDVGAPAIVAVNDKAESLLPGDSDYLSHHVQPTDTLQGICLKYHVTPTEIRQSNRFSGSNLALAPDSLMIPLKRNLPPIVKQPAQDSKDQKINAFMRIMNSKVGGAGKMKERIGRKEAVAYLEINDYNVEESVADAKDDLGWEAQDARNKYCQNATAESSLLIEMA
eukprot:256375_1